MLLVKSIKFTEILVLERKERKIENTDTGRNFENSLELIISGF